MNLVIHNSTVSRYVGDSYTPSSLDAAESLLASKDVFSVVPTKSGLYPAAGPGHHLSYSGYENVWVRDNIWLAHAFQQLGHVDKSRVIVSSIESFYMQHKDRLVLCIQQPSIVADVQKRPHIRFNGNNLKELDVVWPHAQNDAIGYYVWMSLRLVQADNMSLKESTADLIANFALYMWRIEYWNDSDSGHWEEEQKVQASSIGIVLSALQMLLHLKQSNRVLANALELAELKHSQGFLEEAVAKGRISIERILPWESKTAGLERRYDAALLFLCYPMGIVSDQMETQILEDVQKNLCGTIGISRYLGDTFWGPNYKKIVGDKERTSPIEEVSARRLVDSTGLEAQWCIFDSIISVIYGRRYLRHARPGDRDRQIHFFNRALGQITAEKEVCPWKCPELYYWEDGSFVPGDVVPLYWAQSNLKLAFHYMRKSVG